jgi:hypothetical protein
MRKKVLFQDIKDGQRFFLFIKGEVLAVPRKFWKMKSIRFEKCNITVLSPVCNIIMEMNDGRIFFDGDLYFSNEVYDFEVEE